MAEEYWSFRFLPHGGYALIPAALSTMAWLASLSQDGCDFARLEGPAVEGLSFSDYTPFAELGVRGYRVPKYYEEDRQWRVHYDNTCYRYDDEFRELYPRDGAWDASRRMNFVAMVLGVSGSMFLWLSSYLPFSRGTWSAVGVEMVLAGFFKCFSFIWFQTAVCTTTATGGVTMMGDKDNECIWFYGARTDLVSILLFFATAAVILRRYPSPEEAAGNSEATSENGKNVEGEEDQGKGETVGMLHHSVRSSRSMRVSDVERSPDQLDRSERKSAAQTANNGFWDYSMESSSSKRGGVR